MKIRAPIERIEAHRESRVLVLAATSLDLDLLPSLYDALRAMGQSERLDVLLYCRGGNVNATRRIALLLHEFTDHLTLIVPDRCQSSGTIMALGAHQIVAGPVAVFSPVDPLLNAGSEITGEAPLAISAQDVRLFGEMARQWLGIADAEVPAASLSVLCDNIFPTTLTAFYRSCLETRGVCLELRALASPSTDARNVEIVDRLIYGHHSHTFALTRGDLAELGLPVHGDRATEDLAWEIARSIRGSIGAAARADPDDGWIDAIIATRAGGHSRRRQPSGLAPAWEDGLVE